MVWKILLTLTFTDSPTTIQNLWKKQAWSLSGLGALKAFIELRVNRISASKGGKERFKASESERVLPKERGRFRTLSHMT